MLSLVQLKEQKITDMVCRMRNAMYENYFGGDTLTVKNVVHQKRNEEDLVPEYVHQWFTTNELEFIEKENILDRIRDDGWEIAIGRPEDGDLDDVEWLFTGGKKIKF